MNDLPPPGDPVIAVYTPLRGDSDMIVDALSGLGARLQRCSDDTELRALLETPPCPVLCILLSHESASADVGELLADMATREPSWSAPPVMVLVGSRNLEPPALARLAERSTALPLLIIDRPVHPDALATAVQNQILAREQQFETARLLHQLAESEARQRFLLEEVQHRTRNVLSIVSGMFTLSARRATDVETLAQSFGNRLHSAVQAQVALSSEKAHSEKISDILRTHVEPYCMDPKQLQFKGPELRLEPRASFDFAMVVHELATNAAKYGALSVAEGQILVAWALNDAGRLSVRWQESGGPETVVPERQGLGSAVIRAPALAFEGGAQTEFHPEGLLWQIEMRGDAVADLASDPPAAMSR